MERLSRLILHQTQHGAAMKDPSQTGSEWLSVTFLVVIAVEALIEDRGRVMVRHRFLFSK
jgi:hypothetical protein